MKRARKIVALAAVVVLTVSASMSVFAEDTSQKFILKSGASYSKSKNEIESNTAITAQSVTKLAYTEKHFYDYHSRDYGVYPQVTDMNDLNKKIEANIREAFGDLRISDTDFAQNYFKVSYTVEENGNYSKIMVNCWVNSSPQYLYGKTYTKTYYVDKTTKLEATQDDYDKKEEEDTTENTETEAPDAPANGFPGVINPTTPAAPADEFAADMVPLRFTAESLGYTVSWNAADKTVDVSKGFTKASLVTGINAYQAPDGKIVELEEAPTLIDSVLYVPTSFFSEILGLNVEIDENGEALITEK